MVRSETHTWSSRASSHTQLTASMMNLNLGIFVALHVVLTVAYHCFHEDPHACREPRFHPIFLFPHSNYCPSNLFLHCHGTGELCLRLDGIFHNESVTHEGCQNCLDIHSLVHLALSLNSAFGSKLCQSFRRKKFSFLPCFRGQKRDSERLFSNHRSRQQVPKHD